MEVSGQFHILANLPLGKEVKKANFALEAGR
jgi:hypothetical protein